jgi:WD40 repeat protein
LDSGQDVYPTADGQQLVGVDNKKPYGLKVWDLKAYKLPFTIPAQFEPWGAKGKAIALSQDSRTLVLSPGLSDNRIEVWDIKAGKKLKSFNENGKAGITSMAIAADNQQMATAAGNTLFLWDLNQGKLLRTIPKAGAVRRMIFSSSGVVTAAEDRLDLWDVKTGKSLKTVKHKSPGIITFALRPDGKAFAFYRYSDKLVKIWKLP